MTLPHYPYGDGSRAVPQSGATGRPQDDAWASSAYGMGARYPWPSAAPSAPSGNLYMTESASPWPGNSSPQPPPSPPPPPPKVGGLLHAVLLSSRQLRRHKMTLLYISLLHAKKLVVTTKHYVSLVFSYRQYCLGIFFWFLSVFIIFHYFLCVWIYWLPVCLWATRVCLVPLEGWSPRTGVTYSYELPCSFWESNLGPQEDQCFYLLAISPASLLLSCCGTIWILSRISLMMCSSREQCEVAHAGLGAGLSINHRHTSCLCLALQALTIWGKLMIKSQDELWGSKIAWEVFTRMTCIEVDSKHRIYEFCASHLKGLSLYLPTVLVSDGYVGASFVRIFKYFPGW